MVRVRLFGWAPRALIERGKGRNAVAKTEADQKVGDLEMTARWKEAEENTAKAKTREAVTITKPMVDAMRQGLGPRRRLGRIAAALPARCVLTPSPVDA